MMEITTKSSINVKAFRLPMSEYLVNWLSAIIITRLVAVTQAFSGKFLD